MIMCGFLKSMPNNPGRNEEYPAKKETKTLVFLTANNKLKKWRIKLRGKYNFF
jgi:hypothetical protein